MSCKPNHACAVQPEVLKSWSLEIDYSRALCLGADQKARGLLERDCKNHINFERLHVIINLFSFIPQSLLAVSEFLSIENGLRTTCFSSVWASSNILLTMAYKHSIMRLITSNHYLSIYMNSFSHTCNRI